MSEYIANIFRTYREVKVKVLTHLQNKSLERAELANRFRRNKSIHVGDQVLLKDRRQQRAGGRTPWKQPLTDPVTVKEVHGNKATVTTADGTELKDIHLEDMLLHPEAAKNLETREALEFPEDDNFEYIDDLNVKRSLREMHHPSTLACLG